MAKETVTKLIDDLDGGVAAETVKFALDGHSYEIDLSAKNAKKLRTELAGYIEHSIRVRHQPGRSGAARGRRTDANPADQNRAIREWAQRKGMGVAPRGRIRQDIIDAYQEAQGR
jgi:hypothetical protein